MNNRDFPTLVKKYFHYLEEDFHYSIVEKLSNINPNYGAIEFRSVRTVLRVIRQEDRPTDVVYIIIRPLDAPDEIGMSLKIIVDALEIGVDLPDDHTPPQLFEDITKEYAEIVSKYCTEFIKGDFSRWNLILRYYIENKRNWYKSVLGEELPTIALYQVIQTYIEHEK
jgi:hypothetical protein